MIEKKGLYVCEECEMKYKNREWAGKCEEFCRENKACSTETPRILEIEFLGALKNAKFSVLDVTRHAVK
jgi:predicted ATP-dependent serine protease